MNLRYRNAAYFCVVAGISILAACSGPDAVAPATRDDSDSSAEATVQKLASITGSDIASSIDCEADKADFSRLSDARFAINPKAPDKLLLVYMSTEPYGLFSAYSENGGNTWAHEVLRTNSNCVENNSDFNLFGDHDVAATSGGAFAVLAVEGITAAKETIENSKIRRSTFLPGGEKLGDVGMQVVSYTRTTDGTWTRADLTSPTHLQYHHTTAIDYDESSESLIGVWATPQNPFPVQNQPGFLPDNTIYTSVSRDNGRSWTTPTRIPIEPWIGQQVWDMHSQENGLTSLHLNDNELFVGSIADNGLTFDRKGSFPLPTPYLPLYSFSDGSIFAGDRPLAGSFEGSVYQVAATFSEAQQADVSSFLQRFISDEEISIPVSFAERERLNNLLQVSRSDDQGDTWSKPVAIPGADKGVFHAHASVTPDGTVGLLWYDLRHDEPGDGALTTQVYFGWSSDQGASWHATPISDLFDMKHAPLYIYSHYLGNYQALEATADGDFIAAFAVPSEPSTGSHLEIVRIAPPPIGD